MISRAHRMVFIHIPKAAGTSIELAFEHHSGDGATWGSQDHRTLRQLQRPRVTQLVRQDNALEFARSVRARTRRPSPGTDVISRADLAAFWKFAVVRNPWARAWSWYRNVRADPLQQRRLGVPADITFARFVATQAGRDLLRPQLYWLVDYAGRIGVDQVCRFENLVEDFADVCARAGLAGLALPHTNAGQGMGDHRDAYDDRSRRIVADVFRHEIELFGFEFDHTVGRRPRAGR